MSVCENMLASHILRSLPRRLRRIPASSIRPRLQSSITSNLEVLALQEEIQALKALLADNNRKYEILSQQVQTQSMVVEGTLDEIHTKVNLMCSPLERLAALASAFAHNIDALVAYMHRFDRYSKWWTNKYSLSVMALLLVFLWGYRYILIDRTSEEVAELASRTLQQESLQRTIQQTLDAIANSPQTLQTLNSLLQNILRDPSTMNELVRLVENALQIPEIQQSLMHLLEKMLADPTLHQQVAEFVVQSFETELVKEMLESQTQSLIRNVVTDASVQQATAVGVQQSLWYTVVPKFLWPAHKQESPETCGKDSTRNATTTA